MPHKRLTQLVGIDTELKESDIFLSNLLCCCASN